MSGIVIRGCGVVSPAGWGVSPFSEALAKGVPIPGKELNAPGCPHPRKVRTVPAALPKPSFVGHARLRRTSPIAHYSVAAALEALGADAPRITKGGLSLGVIHCVMCGCVNYSRRFYDETLKDPSTASPVLFPETVFNAPASHLAALLGAQSPSYTLVGDQGAFLHGLSLAADWLNEGRVAGCLVIGAEEMDWLTVEAVRLFNPRIVLSEGAAALYLKREKDTSGMVTLDAITNPYLFTRKQPRRTAAQLARRALGPLETNSILCDGLQSVPGADRDEAAAWQDWCGPRLSPKQLLGESFTAAAGWQCVAGVLALQQAGYSAAHISVVGSNEQAIAAQFAGIRPASPRDSVPSTPA